MNIVIFRRAIISFTLVLNLGHSPLYRHFCKCLHIELLKFRLIFLTIAYIFFVRQLESKLSLYSLIGNVGILPIHFIS